MKCVRVLLLQDSYKSTLSVMETNDMYDVLDALVSSADDGITSVPCHSIIT